MKCFGMFGLVAGVDEVRYVYVILVVQPEGKSRSSGWVSILHLHYYFL